MQDHLGNTRVVYQPLFCGEESLSYDVEYVGDYFPYAKTIREYVKEKKEKFLSTHHQRDEETGLDYRGARFYDGDIGRFLSLDPLAVKYPQWSDYNYVLGNPIRFVDPDGRSVEDNIVFDKSGRYLRIEKTDDKFDQIVIEDQKTGTRTNYQFNDPEHDSKLIKATIENGYAQNDIPIVYFVSQNDIDNMFKESDVRPMSAMARFFKSSTQSKGGKLDFSVYHLPVLAMKKQAELGVPEYLWKEAFYEQYFNEVMDHETGAVKEESSYYFINPNENKAYNHFDTGNWLWGNAMNKMGFDLNTAIKGALYFNSNDSGADLNAIKNGYNSN